jgi:integrase
MERRSFGRIRKCQPSGRYQAAYTGPDGIIYKAPSTYGQREDAEGWLIDRRREIDRDLWSPPATVEQKKAKRERLLTFGEYSDAWLEARRVKGRPLRPRTKNHYRDLLDKHLLPTFGKKPIKGITPDMVDRWYDQTAPTAPTLRAHCYSLLSTIMDSARKDRRRLIEVNPCMIDGAARSPDPRIDPTPATVEQLDILFAAMPDHLRALVHLTSWCAMRWGEITELRRGDIDIERREVKITRQVIRDKDENGKGKFEVGPPKSDAGIRTVAVPMDVWPDIQRHLDLYVDRRADALLFPAKSGSHLQPSTVYRHFYKARDAAGRPDLRLHDCRHTGATLYAQTNATLAEIMERLGHSTVTAAMRYQHVANGRDRQNADRMSELARPKHVDTSTD